MPATAELRRCLVDWLVAERGAPAALDDHTDLFEAGLLDSLAFVALAAQVQAATGRGVDLSETDPAELATIDGWLRHLHAAAPSPEASA